VSEWRATTVYHGAAAAEVAAFQLDAARRAEWDAGVEAYALLASAAGAQGGPEAPELQFWRMRFPTPFAPRDYICTRRLWRDAQADTVYVVAKAAACPAAAEAAIPAGRSFRVERYASGIRVRPVPGGAELATLYHEDCGIAPRLVDAAAKRGLWSFVERQAAAQQAYAPDGARIRAIRPRRFGARATLRVLASAAGASLRAAVTALAAKHGRPSSIMPERRRSRVSGDPVVSATRTRPRLLASLSRKASAALASVRQKMVATQGRRGTDAAGSASPARSHAQFVLLAAALAMRMCRRSDGEEGSPPPVERPRARHKHHNFEQRMLF